jgi:hypothetical protein
MRFLRNLGVGDSFRPAHPRQQSLNKRSMARDSTYKILKVYPMAPNLVISSRVDAPEDGFYSLGPNTPVLLPKEFDPSEKEVLAFLNRKSRLKALGYRVTWDGVTDISGLLPAQGVAMAKLLFSYGNREITMPEIIELTRRHFEAFWGRKGRQSGEWVFRYYRRFLLDRGIIEEIVGEAPVTEAIRDANLQEVL